MSEKNLTYRKFILDEFHRRQRRNPAYSWRAFARDLKVAASRLNELMSGKGGISAERALVFAEAMDLDKKDTTLFIDLVEMEHSRSQRGKDMAKERVKNQLLPWRDISNEIFSSFSEWYYIPLVTLLGTQLESYDPAYLGRRLGLSASEMTIALQKLLDLNLIENKNGALVPTDGFQKTQTGPSKARRQYLKDLLKKAEAAIEVQPLEKRSFTSATIAVDPSQIEAVQEKIRQFGRDLMKELDAGPKKTSVYCLSVNFFELTVN